MKRRTVYLLPVLLVAGLFIAGCVSNKNSNPKPAPTGTFTGEFRLLTREPGATVIDTAKANIKLTFENGGTFKVLGDTSIIHAGSKGKFEFNTSTNLVAFTDDTYPKTGKPAKIHLHGVYQYFYQNNVFQMVANGGDTLSLQYDLKKLQ